MQLPLVFQLGNPFLQVMNPAMNPPPVHLQLCFARAPCTDAASLPGKHQPLPTQPWQVVPELCQLHLQLAGSRPGPLGKNIQNQGRPVHYPQTGTHFQIALLGRADFIIHNQQIRFHILCQHANLINLAPA